jgi:demethylmenaquinone methyltransferase/2-methoxy-6-polyprenyl-1,4-benzoquinol methylase
LDSKLNRQISKKENVTGMFNNIARYYDFLNHFLSLNRDVVWRRKAIDELVFDKPKIILDVATGTADLAIEASRLNPDKIIGIDISDNMLELAKEKIKKRQLSQLIEFQNGDSENLPFPESHSTRLLSHSVSGILKTSTRGLQRCSGCLRKKGG